MTNRRIPASQALEWGMVNEVVPSVQKNSEFVVHASPEEIAHAQKGEDGYSINLSKLDEAVDALAGELIDKFPEAMRYTKAQVNFWKKFAWHQTIDHARDWLAVHFASWEPAEGMGAFVEKRSPRYRMFRERAAAGLPSEFPWGAYSQRCSNCGAEFLPEAFGLCGQCGKALDGRGLNP
jgi:enoyl-CoA hydratase/carnithine racemase